MSRSGARLLRDVLIYGSGTVAAKIVGLVLFPVLTRTFTQAQFGAYELLLTMGMVMMEIVVLGMEYAVTLHFHDKNVDRRSMLSTALYWRILWSILFTVLALAVLPLLDRTLFGPASPLYRTALMIAIIDLPLVVLVNFALNILRQGFRPRDYLILSVGNLVLMAGFTIFFVVGQERGVEGVFLARLIADAATALGGLLAIRRFLGFTFSTKDLLTLLRVGGPAVFAGLSLLAIHFADRYFLRYFHSLNEVGIYAAGIRVSYISWLFIFAFQQAYTPFSLSIASEPGARNMYARLSYLYYLGCSLGGLALALFSPEILSILAPGSYLEAARVIPLLTYGLIIYGSFHVFVVGVNLKKKTLHVGWTTLFAALLNLALNMILVPRFSILGAAVATLASQIAAVALIYVLSQRVYPIPYLPGRMVTIWALTGALTIPLYLFPLEPFGGAMVFKLVAAVCLPLLFFIFRLASVEDVKSIARTILEARKAREES